MNTPLDSRLHSGTSNTFNLEDINVHSIRDLLQDITDEQLQTMQEEDSKDGFGSVFRNVTATLVADGFQNFIPCFYNPCRAQETESNHIQQCTLSVFEETTQSDDPPILTLNSPQYSIVQHQQPQQPPFLLAHEFNRTQQESACSSTENECYVPPLKKFKSSTDEDGHSSYESLNFEDEISTSGCQNSVDKQNASIIMPPITGQGQLRREFCIPNQYTLATDDDGDTDLHVLATYPNYESLHQEVIKHIPPGEHGIDAMNNNGQTALHVAMLGENNRYIDALLQRGAKFDLFDIDGNTPLHIGCEMNSLWKVQLLLKKNRNGLSYDFKRNEKINHQNNSGHSAWHLACKHQNIDMMRLLVQNGADVDLRDGRTGATALIHALDRALTTTNKQQKESCIKFATNLVADFHVCVKTQTYNEDTPLHFASLLNNMELVVLFLDKGVEVSWKSLEKKTPKDLSTDIKIKEILEKRRRKERRTKKKEEDKEPDD